MRLNGLPSGFDDIISLFLVLLGCLAVFPLGSLDLDEVIRGLSGYCSYLKGVLKSSTLPLSLLLTLCFYLDD